MNVPDDLRYSSDHEWVRLEDGKVRIGITDYAQDALGDVVFVAGARGRRTTVGRRRHGQRGRVHQVGLATSTPRWPARSSRSTPTWTTAPERVNDDPYGEGWICVIELADPGALESLLDAAAYRELIEG